MRCVLVSMNSNSRPAKGNVFCFVLLFPSIITHFKVFPSQINKHAHLHTNSHCLIHASTCSHYVHAAYLCRTKDHFAFLFEPLLTRQSQIIYCSSELVLNVNSFAEPCKMKEFFFCKDLSCLERTHGTSFISAISAQRTWCLKID